MKSILLLACAVLAMATPPGNTPAKQSAKASSGTLNEQRWSAATVKPAWIPALDKAVWRYQRDQRRYLVIERQRRGGMPAPIVFAIHGRESTWDFTCHLHEGSPLTHRTRYVPKGRPLGTPPFSFEQSAEDALYILKREDSVRWPNADAALSAIEAYNGTGYLRFHPDVPSPYLWSGTQIYGKGKYVSDGRFSPTAVDQQPGVAAILLRMRERGLAVPF